MKRIPIKLLSVVVLALQMHCQAGAQNDWIDAGKISSGSVLCFSTYSDSIIFAGCDRDGLFISSDRGRTWRKVDSFPSIGVSVLYRENDSVLLAGTPKGIYRSDNRGMSWSGPLPGSGSHTVLSIVRSPGGEMVAGYREGGILISRNGGTDWTKALEGHTITSLVRATDGTLYCISDNQRILSAKENHELWNEYPHPLPDRTRPMTLTIDGQSLLAGTTDGIYESSDTSGTWKALFRGKPADPVVRTADGSLYFGSPQNGLLSWERNSDGYYVSRQRYKANTTAICVLGDKEFVIGTAGGRIAVSSPLIPPVPKGPDDWNCYIRFPITLGFKSSATFGFSVEIRPAKFASLQIIQSISADLEGQRVPFQLRGIVYPIAGSGLYAGAGYFHFTGYSKQGMPGNFEYFACDGPEFLVGYRLPFLADVEAGWRHSNQPWGIFYHQFQSPVERGLGEVEYLNEFFFVINLHIFKF